jgi:thiamine pyrophosphate-dependent acetolactate synthase large subunit-like protein
LVEDPRLRRHEALRGLSDAFPEHQVVCYAGAACEELYASGDDERFVYVLGSMGLSSSIGLGLSLAGSRPVLAFEGDGSLLMNLGALVTARQWAPPGFVFAIIDNAQHASTGGQPTATADGLDLAAVARAVGWSNVETVDSLPSIRGALADEARDPRLIHVRVEPGDGPRRRVDLAPAEIVRRAGGRHRQ